MDTLITNAPEPLTTLDRLKFWTVQDYHRMSETGILDPNERTELIAGQITLMVAKETPHVITLQLLASELLGQLGTTALIRTQDPIHLDDSSEPEPDLVIVRGEILDYVDRHPQPTSIHRRLLFRSPPFCPRYNHATSPMTN